MEGAEQRLYSGFYTRFKVWSHHSGSDYARLRPIVVLFPLWSNPKMVLSLEVRRLEAFKV